MRCCGLYVCIARVVVLTCVLGRFSIADDAASNQAEPASEPFVRITQSGLVRYTDEAWGIVQATAFNRGTEPVEVNGVAWFASDPGLQFSRRFVVPPGSMRTVWMPVLTPDLPDGADSVDVQWATIRKDGTLISNQQGERLSDTTIRLPRTKLVIAEIKGDSQKQQEASELLRNIRHEIRQDAKVLSMIAPPFPPSREAWDIADIMVVTSDEIAADSAALNAVRLWTQDGGRLWLQLDQIQSGTVAALLGDTLPFEEIDRTSTVDVEMTPDEDSRPFKPQRIGFERPVAFTRVLVQPPASIHQRLDGWPAVFSFPFGNGKVFCTAADLSAWFAPRHWRRQEEIAGATDAVWFDASEAGKIVLQELIAAYEPTVAPEVLEDYVVSQVGYTTPRRSSVAGLLIGFTVVLSIVSLGLHFRQKAGWMLWTIPLMAVVASAGLVAVGQAARGKPKGRVFAQIVESEPGQTTAFVTEALTYYTDETLTVDDSVTPGSPLIPDRAGVASSRWRVEWSGIDEWALKGVDLPPGVRIATNRTHLEFQQPLRAAATFDENGLTGRLTLPLGLSVEDALIGGSARVTQSAVQGAEGTFTADGSVLPPGEYLSSSLLDSEQSRRQSVYREVFRVKGRTRPTLQSPHLLFWSQPLVPGSGATAVRDEAGASLFLVPLELQRPREGSEILIPGSFLNYSAVSMTTTGGTPSYFNNRIGEWTETRNGSRILLRFQIPPEVLPVTPTSATLTIKLAAGSRKVTFRHGLPGQLTESGTLDSPVGTFDVSLKSDSRIVLDERGGLHVLLEVGDVETADDTAASEDVGGVSEVKDENWKVDWMSLSLRARVGAGASADSRQSGTGIDQ